MGCEEFYEDLMTTRVLHNEYVKKRAELTVYVKEILEKMDSLYTDGFLVCDMKKDISCSISDLFDLYEMKRDIKGEKKVNALEFEKLCAVTKTKIDNSNCMSFASSGRCVGDGDLMDIVLGENA